MTVDLRIERGTATPEELAALIVAIHLARRPAVAAAPEHAAVRSQRMRSWGCPASRPAATLAPPFRRGHLSVRSSRWHAVALAQTAAGSPLTRAG
jgi:hypothetical protein